MVRVFTRRQLKSCHGTTRGRCSSIVVLTRTTSKAPCNDSVLSQWVLYPLWTGVRYVWRTIMLCVIRLWIPIWQQSAHSLSKAMGLVFQIPRGKQRPSTAYRVFGVSASFAQHHDNRQITALGRHLNGIPSTITYTVPKLLNNCVEVQPAVTDVVTEPEVRCFLFAVAKRPAEPCCSGCFCKYWHRCRGPSTPSAWCSPSLNLKCGCVEFYLHYSSWFCTTGGCDPSIIRGGLDLDAAGSFGATVTSCSWPELLGFTVRRSRTPHLMAVASCSCVPTGHREKPQLTVRCGLITADMLF